MKKRKGCEMYSTLVTTSDEAFAFMVLEKHKAKWDNPQEEGSATERISGKEKAECVNWYHKKELELRQFKDSNKENVERCDRWLAQQQEKQLLEDTTTRTTRKQLEDGESEDDDMNIEHVNPYLKDVIFEAKV